MVGIVTMRHNIYLKQPAEDGMKAIFDYLQKLGDIPANATEIGQYKAQIITFAINCTLGSIAEDAAELARQQAARREG